MAGIFLIIIYLFQKTKQYIKTMKENDDLKAEMEKLLPKFINKGWQTSRPVFITLDKSIYITYLPLCLWSYAINAYHHFTLWVRNLLMVRCTQYYIMLWRLSVTCSRSENFWYIVESGIKHHNPNPTYLFNQLSKGFCNYLMFVVHYGKCRYM